MYQQQINNINNTNNINNIKFGSIICMALFSSEYLFNNSKNKPSIIIKNVKNKSTAIFYYCGKLISNICNCYPYIDDKTIYNQSNNLLTSLYNHIKKFSISSAELLKEIALFITCPLYIIKGYFDYIHFDDKSYIVSYMAHCNTLLLVYFVSLCIPFIKNYKLYTINLLNIDFDDC